MAIVDPILLNQQNPQTSIFVATQTDTNPPISNVGQGRHPIDESKHDPRLFGEEFLAEATLKDKTLQAIIKFVKAHKWEELKQFTRFYLAFQCPFNDLSIAPTGCLLYDGKPVIPYQLQNLVINAVHRTHPGQVGMIRLANLIWFPQIHCTIMLHAEKLQTVPRPK